MNGLRIMMRKTRQFWLSVVFILGVSALCGISGAADINAAIGDRVNLTGTTVGTDTIYLFVTGPGLAPDGVRLDAMSMEVISGMPSTFTVVDVSNDRWAYSWNTARQGFTLKEGIYTVYATKNPVSKADIRSSTYDTVDVSLTYSGAPFQTGGTVSITTTPIRAEVYIDNNLVGLTPQTLTLPEGTHTLSLVSGGYQTINESISVQRGSSIEINRTMVPLSQPTTAPVTSVPTPVASLTPPATATNLPPATTTQAPGPVTGLIAGVFVAFIVLRKTW